nr:MAG TPA: hypothetical protein [Caudoviricetes sp.]
MRSSLVRMVLVVRTFFSFNIVFFYKFGFIILIIYFCVVDVVL